MSPAVTDRDPTVATLAAERRYGAATVARWQQLPAPDAHALATLVAELRPSENQLRDLWEWAADVATRDGLSLAHVLEHDSLRTVRQRPLARAEKLKLVKGALRRLRYPRLATTETALAAHVRALGLPRTVRVEFPEFLEGDDVRITFVARSTTDWAHIAQALLTAATDPRCAALFELLAEPPAAGAPPGTPTDAE